MLMTVLHCWTGQSSATSIHDKHHHQRHLICC